jgi:hypothetical protein
VRRFQLRFTERCYEVDSRWHVHNKHVIVEAENVETALRRGHQPEFARPTRPFSARNVELTGVELIEDDLGRNR